MPDYDLLVYHDFSSGDVEVAIGDPGSKLGDIFAERNVVAVGPPIHKNKDATVVLASSSKPMEEIQERLDRPSEEEILERMERQSRPAS
jgi:hypothetical protein